MLIKLRQYIQEHRAASLDELAKCFAADPDIIRDMLGHWVRKGKIKLAAKAQHCGISCQQCKPALTEVYVWFG